MIHDTLQAQGRPLPLVSVIIPIYNAQDYIEFCLRSVLDQTYPNLEILCIDDGSTDQSVEIIKKLTYNDLRVTLIQIENHGQGYARNLGLQSAKGEYVFFLDADDFIEPITIDLAVTRAEADMSDFVVFDWRYYNPVSQSSNYCNTDLFFSEYLLEKENCLKLLQVPSMFTVNKLYRHSFLKNWNIKYGEGYLYEDIPYWIKAVLFSSKVSLIHSPLYRITIHQTSSTKTAIDTDRHCKSYIQAMSESIAFINSVDRPISDKARYDIAKYFMEKFIYYYLQRTPKKFQNDFLRQFVDELSRLDFQNCGNWRLFSTSIALDVFRKKSYLTFTLLFYAAAVYKPAIERFLKKGKGIGKKLYHGLQQKKANLLPSKYPLEDPWQEYAVYVKQSLYSDVILFMGFDFRYTGNSRYLFEEMVRKKPMGKKLFFVTNDPLVPLQYRLEPNSDRCIKFMARAKTVIFESWIPLKYKKRADAVWIQLWHGTPLKRMLFDSNEKAILTHNPEQKTSKFSDISRWDYLVVDTPTIKSFFQTAFLFPPERMLATGYPRVKYLIEKQSDLEYKTMLRSLYRIPLDKEIVLYLPTWRDYNYKKSDNDCDTEYALDVTRLQALLGDKYFVISKDHAFLSKLRDPQSLDYKDVETQDLLLVANYLITDYSSVMFDAFAIDLPVVLYCTDFEKNEMVRGVYSEIWNQISHLNCTTVEAIVASIEHYCLDEKYKKAKEKYGYRPEATQKLSAFIENL